MLSMMVTSSALRDLTADSILDLVAEPRRLFDSRAGVRTHVQLELAAVDRGKEVLSQPRIEQSKRAKPEARTTIRNTLRYSRQNSDPVVPTAQLFEAVLEGELEADKGIAALPRLFYASCSCPFSRYFAMVGTMVRERK